MMNRHDRLQNGGHNHRGRSATESKAIRPMAPLMILLAIACVTGCGAHGQVVASPLACSEATVPSPIVGNEVTVASPLVGDEVMSNRPTTNRQGTNRVGSVKQHAAPSPSKTIQRAPIIGGPCEGCEAVFEGLPHALSAVARIAPPEESGDPMRIEGTVRHNDATPAPGIIVYAYHTNKKGIYPKDEKLHGKAAYRHGKLRGWVQTDEKGRYRFDTIRPAGYPDSDMPQHVHMHVIEPGHCTYFIDSIVFDDDPRLTDDWRKQYSDGRGGKGVVNPRRGEKGLWHVRRDIVLGRGVPDYPACR